MSRIGFLCFLGLLPGVILFRQNLDLFESRLYVTRMRMNVADQEVKTVKAELESLNDSFSEFEQRVRYIRDLNVDVLENSEESRAEWTRQIQKRNRILKGFIEHKAWVYKILTEMGNKISKHKTNSMEVYENMTAIVRQLTEDVELKLNLHNDRIESLTTNIQRCQKNEEVLQKIVGSLKTNVTLLADHLISQLNEKDKMIEDNRLEISKLRGEFMRLTQPSRKMEQVCPDRWEKWKGNCYLFTEIYKTYAEAKMFCSDYGAHLVDIQSIEENAYVIEMSTFRGNWLGLTVTGEEGEWKWDSTGEIATFTNWRPERLRFRNRSQYCAAIAYNNPEWFVRHCAYNLSPLCKMKLPI